MKTRVNLNFFLSRRGGSLERFCEISGIKTKSELLGFLDDACVDHPEEWQIAGLFQDRPKVAKVAVQEPISQQPPLTETKGASPSGSEKKSRRSSRRRQTRARSSSSSEE